MNKLFSCNDVSPATNQTSAFAVSYVRVDTGKLYTINTINENLSVSQTCSDALALELTYDLPHTV